MKFKVFIKEQQEEVIRRQQGQPRPQLQNHPRLPRCLRLRPLRLHPTHLQHFQHFHHRQHLGSWVPRSIDEWGRIG